MTHSSKTSSSVDIASSMTVCNTESDPHWGWVWDGETSITSSKARHRRKALHKVKLYILAR